MYHEFFFPVSPSVDFHVPWVPEAFHARFPVSVKSACDRRSSSSHARKKPPVPRVAFMLLPTKHRDTQRRFPPKCIENAFSAIQSTFSSLEMHSKQRYKICISSVVLGQLESFRNYKGLRIIFPKLNFRCNFNFYEREFY